MKTAMLILMLSVACRSAVQFDGSNDFITLYRTGTASNFTAACWFKQRAGGATVSTGSGGVGAMYPLVSKAVGEADNSNLDGNYVLGIATNKLSADLEVLAGGANKPLYGTTTLLTNNNAWYHGAITFDGLNFTLWLNGVAEATRTSTPPRFDSLQHLCLGRTCNSTGALSGAFSGFIDQVLILDTALTAGQMKQLYESRSHNVALGLAPTNVLHYLTLDEYAPGFASDITLGVKSIGRKWMWPTFQTNMFGSASNGVTWAGSFVGP